MDLVENCVVKGRKVRSTRRRFERDVICNNGDRVGCIWTPERVNVGVVCHRVLTDQGRLTVTGGFARQHCQSYDHQSSDCDEKNPLHDVILLLFSRPYIPALWAFGWSQ